MYGKLESHRQRVNVADKHNVVHSMTFGEKQQTGPAMELKRPKGPAPSPLEKTSNRK